MSSMDVDPIEEDGVIYYGSGQTESYSRTPWTVVVDNAHPFDLDTYISVYSGKPLCYPCQAVVGL